MRNIHLVSRTFRKTQPKHVRSNCCCTSCKYTFRNSRVDRFGHRKCLTNFDCKFLTNFQDSYAIYTPGIYALFKKFDTKYFESKLKNVKIEWSKRMNQCAGICYQYRNRPGNPITIRLSEPLLKLRPRRYTVDTLLVCVSSHSRATENIHFIESFSIFSTR